MKSTFYGALIIIIFLSACSTQQAIHKEATRLVLKDSSLLNAHVGISVFDPSSNKYLYNYQGEKYFVPASNTKIFTCYAGLKYLGDSLTGMRYWENDTAIYLIPCGDPTLLHPDFKTNRVIDFLKKASKPLYILDDTWKSSALGDGWSWNDYNDDYMAERSPLPVYGNVLHWIQEKNDSVKNTDNVFDQSPSVYSIPEVNWKVHFNVDPNAKSFFVLRGQADNSYTITQGTEKRKEQVVPFVTNGMQSALELLPDTIGKAITVEKRNMRIKLGTSMLYNIHSHPVDSLFIPMMHRSDNFYAEQTLLMVSNAVLAVMDDKRMIDALLRSDFRDLPQKPHWVDGSGLSRYNLITPQCFVGVLNKMQKEFGMERLKKIFPTGGTGTLGNYYKQDSGFIYAKTGSLSGVLCLSGYLYTKKKKFLIFSILVNNHHSSASAIRKAIESFINGLREKY